MLYFDLLKLKLESSRDFLPHLVNAVWIGEQFQRASGNGRAATRPYVQVQIFFGTTLKVLLYSETGPV